MPSAEEAHDDPALERFVGANGTGPISTRIEEEGGTLLCDGYPATDMGNAHRLVDHHGENIRYVTEWGWLVWTGARWQRDATALVMRYAKDTIRSMIRDAGERLTMYANDRQHGDDLAKAKKLIKHAESSGGSRKLNSMIELAKSEPGIIARPDDFDADPMLLNCENCTIELATGEAREHRREDYLTRKCPTLHQAEAKCPAWDAFLLDVFGTPALADYMARVFGYCLTGTTTEHAMFILHGTGSNGKSTLVNTLMAVLGEDYAAQVGEETLTKHREGGANNDVARLRGIRLASTIEVGEGRGLNEALIKQLTGGDKVTARFLYKESFEFYPEFKFLVAANHRPVIRGQDHGIWRRPKLIPFERTFTDAQKDPLMGSKLLAEKSGILAWGVRGAQAWAAGGLLTPEVVQAATIAYKEEMDDLGEFMETLYEYPGASCACVELYSAYRAWAENRGDKPMHRNGFGRRISDRGFRQSKERGVRVWLGMSTMRKPTSVDDFEPR